jgi:antitoxin HicB
MRCFEYPAALKAERGGVFTVTFLDLPEATSGKDRADALNQAADCLEEAIAGRIADELDIPVPSTPKAIGCCGSSTNGC